MLLPIQITLRYQAIIQAFRDIINRTEMASLFVYIYIPEKKLLEAVYLVQGLL